MYYFEVLEEVEGGGGPPVEEPILILAAVYLGETSVKRG
jgi:hypothetical protein